MEAITFSNVGESFEKNKQDSPFQVHGGDVKDHSFEPEDHEEPLREGAVSNALAIASRL